MYYEEANLRFKSFDPSLKQLAQQVNRQSPWLRFKYDNELDLYYNCRY